MTATTTGRRPAAEPGLARATRDLAARLGHDLDSLDDAAVLAGLDRLRAAVLSAARR